MTKIAIILGRGIEGCGVTRASINLYNYFIKNGIDCNVFASLDKKRPRRKNQANNIIEFTNNEIENISKQVNECDYVYYASLPSKSHSIEYCKLFEEFLVDKITTNKIMIQHDHNIMSLNRNYNMREITKKMNLSFNFSKDSEFGVRARSLGVEVIEMINGFEFEKYRKFILPFEYRKKRITYFGRFASFKNPIRLVFMHEFLQKYGFITEMRGIERSLGALPIFYSDIKGKKYRDNIELNTNAIQTNEKVYIYGPYVYEEGLKEMSKSMFGANFYNLKKGLGRHVEFATLEVAAVGCLPVVDKGRAEKTVYKDGIKYIDIKDAFIFSDKDNLEETVIEMNKIANDGEEFITRLENCLKILQNVFSLDKAYGELYNNTTLFFEQKHNDMKL